MIDREDMLELTRRMTLTRNCFGRIAGAFMTRDGEIDNTFNTRFLNLSAAEKTKHLGIAKTVPFARTNEQLREHRFSEMGRDSFWQLLYGMLSVRLQNDILMETFYEQAGIFFEADGDYEIIVCHGTYDVPMKSTDKGYLYESEEVYDFLVCTICPLLEDYEPGRPLYGFLYPAFSWRSADREAIDVFDRDPEHPQRFLTEAILGRR